MLQIDLKFKADGLNTLHAENKMPPLINTDIKWD